MARGITGVLALLLVASLAAQEREIGGRVVDGAGEGVAGVEVSVYWFCDGGQMRLLPPMLTDESGAFSGQARVGSRARSIMALDLERGRGAISHLDDQSRREPLELQLQPLARVRVKLACSALGKDWPETAPTAFVSATATGASIAVAAHRGELEVSLPLAAATYRLALSVVDCKRSYRNVTLTPGEELDLGEIDLEPTIIAQHHGKKPSALHVTAARGIEPGVTLADLRGKWVLLEFWGYW